MKTKNPSFTYAVAFLQSGITNVTSEEIIRAVMCDAEEDLIERNPKNDTCLYSDPKDALQLYQDRGADVRHINWVLTDFDTGAVAKRVHGAFSDKGVNSIEDAESILNGTHEDTVLADQVYIWLTNAAVTYIWDCYEGFAKAELSEELVADFLDWRRKTGKDALISDDLADRAIHVIGGNRTFIDVCQRDDDYSVATDGINDYFAGFYAGDDSLKHFLQNPDFKYYLPALTDIVDTVNNGMLTSWFGAFTPNKEQISEFLGAKTDNARTNLAGCAIVMWMIEQVIAQLKAEYTSYQS
ncbi:hypothetical protein [uncultured Psychrobacter sp.]|uniref:hypothetical protein n=1 Tax=uncultured Psychrobacter sp. TaxID=259303 RepID=UPI0030DD06C7